MADATYQTLVYLDSGGDRLNVTSDGQLLVEVGGSININSGATLVLDSGAGLSMASSVNFGLAGQDVAVDDMRRVLISQQETVVIGQGATSTVLSVVNLPKNVKTVILSGTSTMINASFWLTSCSEGQTVWLLYGGNSTSTNSGVVTVSMSGCTLLDSIGVSISTFVMNMSASLPAVYLQAVEDNCWAIVTQRGDIDG